MDAPLFDALARRLGTRRTALSGLLAGLLLPLDAAARGKNQGKSNGQRQNKDTQGNQHANGKGKGKGKSNEKGKAKQRKQQRTSAQAEPCWRAGTCIPRKGANVSQCDLEGYTAPEGLNCTGCNISRANLHGANLSGANLTRANLSGSCLVDATLSGAIVTNTTNLYNAIFCRTVMPDGSINNSGCGSGTPCCPTCDAVQLCISGCCDTTAGACGSCPSGSTCGGGNPGNPGICGCTPTTCQALGKNCGQVADGCGGFLDCGACTAPQTCGGGGTVNFCGCTNSTCPNGATCGTIPNVCGGTVSCGSCAFPGQPCTNNVCGTCVPSCTGKACGAGNDCGGTCTACSPTCLTGSCPSGQRCREGTCAVTGRTYSCSCGDGSVRSACGPADCGGSSIVAFCTSLCANNGGYAGATCFGDTGSCFV